MLGNIFGKNMTEEEAQPRSKKHTAPVVRKTDCVTDQVAAKMARDEQLELIETNNELHRKQQEFKRRRMFGGQ